MCVIRPNRARITCRKVLAHSLTYLPGHVTKDGAGGGWTVWLGLGKVHRHMTGVQSTAGLHHTAREHGS